MREADRPVEERLSVLDRPYTDADALPDHIVAAPGRAVPEGVDKATIRLALVVEDRRLYVGRAVGDDIFQFFFDSQGGGIWGGPRSVLVSHGAAVGWSSNQHRNVVHGIVPDTVTSVRVGTVEATVANNAFIADVRAGEGPVVLTMPSGERVVPRPGVPPSPPDSTAGARGKAYVGLVEYAWSGYPTLQIDDLDSTNWQGTPTGVFLINANAPDTWFVGVVLLDGPRAGELATADLIVQRDDSGATRSVRFSGRTAFAPHPHPPRLEAARHRLAELGQQLDPLGPA